jgi:hypothetical protein
MKMLKAQAWFFVVFLLAPQVALAQAFGEYGRGLGGATQRQGGAAPKAPGTPGQRGGKSTFQGVDIGGRPLPVLLVVASNQAFLYPRQDDESEKIEQLQAGDTLVPMIQTRGGEEWYMVKTQKGTIGWIKSSDVQEQSGKR